MNDLFEKERLARMDNNYDDLIQIFSEMLKLCQNDNDLLTLVKILSVKRSQSRPAIKWLIKTLFEAKKNEKDFNDFFKLLLQDVIEGKIFLEEERVYISEEIKIRCEKSNDAKEALNVIINVPVETFTMIKEPIIIEYQLEQFRLCIANNDWIRAGLTLKKIRMKYFEESKDIDRKVRLYELMVMLFLGQKKYFEASENYYELSNICDGRTDYVALSSFFCILSTCSSELYDVTNKRKEMLYRLSENKNNDESMRSFVNSFLSQLIINRSFINNISESMKRFIDCSIYVYDLISAIDEHNLRIIENFYSSITLNDMSNIMECSTEDIIERISFLINNKFMRCRIDQQTGIVNFNNRSWNNNVSDVMDKLIKCNHLIHKEKLKVNKK